MNFYVMLKHCWAFLVCCPYPSFHKGGTHSYVTSFSTIKLIEIDLKTIFCLDTNKKVFKLTLIFIDLVEHLNDLFSLTQWKECNIKIEHVFFIGGKLHMFHTINLTTNIVGLISNEDWVVIIDPMKQQCVLVAIGLI